MFNSIVGVDIGTTAVRAVSVRKGAKGKPTITRIGEIGLPVGALVNGELRDPDVVAEALKRLWRKSHFPTRAVAVGIGNQQTLVRRADVLAAGDPNALKEILDEALDGNLPVPTDELVLDGYPMGEFVAKSGNIEIDTFVVGALAAASENIYATLRDAKLRPMRLDHSGFALIRGAVTNYGSPSSVPGQAADEVEHPCEIVVDIGAQTIIVAIHHLGRPALIRSIPGGGESITRALNDQLGIPREQAEYVKQCLGIASVTPENTAAVAERFHSLGLAPDSIATAQHVINMMASALLQNVRETAEFYLASDPYVSGVLRLILAGGGSQLPGLSQRLAAELRTDVGPMTPLATFASSSAKKTRWGRLDPRFSLAFGLALGVK